LANKKNADIVQQTTYNTSRTLSLCESNKATDMLQVLHWTKYLVHRCRERCNIWRSDIATPHHITICCCHSATYIKI